MGDYSGESESYEAGENYVVEICQEAFGDSDFVISDDGGVFFEQGEN